MAPNVRTDSTFSQKTVPMTQLSDTGSTLFDFCFFSELAFSLSYSSIATFYSFISIYALHSTPFIFFPFFIFNFFFHEVATLGWVILFVHLLPVLHYFTFRLLSSVWWYGGSIMRHILGLTAICGTVTRFVFLFPVHVVRLVVRVVSSGGHHIPRRLAPLNGFEVLWRHLVGIGLDGRPPMVSPFFGLLRHIVCYSMLYLFFLPIFVSVSIFSRSLLLPFLFSW